MLAKTYTAALLVLGLLIVAAPATASTAINKLDLERDGSFTVLTIHGDGQLRYAHESVEAKEGKPFRIVIDCLASRHNLPQFHFGSLPKSIVTSIRTSQYSVSPEEVVRIVLDLSEESVYRVEPTGGTIKVFVSDQKTAPFQTWTSGTKSTPQEESEKSEPMAKAPTAKPKAPSTKTSPASKPSTASQETKPSTEIAKIPAPDNQQASTQKPAVKTEKSTAKAKPQTEKKASDKAVSAQDLANDSIQRAKAFAVTQPKGGTKPKPSTEQEPVKDKADAEPPRKTSPETKKAPKGDKAVPSTSEPTAPSMVADDKDTELADAGTEPDKVDISRHRRSAAKEAELKASQVVEFPKRMVIQYKKTNPRDPFETLIALNDGDKKRNIDLNQIPNIETLHLVGVLESVLGTDAALLEDRDGIGYILRTGDRVKNGYVAQIDDNSVYFQINEYGWSRTVIKHMKNEN